MIEYTSGLKTLDKVYLDTSFIGEIAFQTKAEGLRELIDKVSKYPNTTKFYFSSWTYGYEQVWIALAKALNTRVSRNLLTYKRSLTVTLRRYMWMTTNGKCTNPSGCKWQMITISISVLRLQP